MNLQNKENNSKSFSEIKLPQKKVAGSENGSYKVYKDENDFVTVEASLVSEAIEKSGISNPKKIVKLENEIDDIISPSSLIDVNNDA